MKHIAGKVESWTPNRYPPTPTPQPEVKKVNTEIGFIIYYMYIIDMIIYKVLFLAYRCSKLEFVLKIYGF